MDPFELSSAIRDRVRSAERVVVFSGAGVSRESGLDTFRGAGGLWERMRPEELATPEAFQANPRKVWQWYAWRYQRVAAASPNPAHEAIARLEAVFSVLYSRDAERRRYPSPGGQPEPPRAARHHHAGFLQPLPAEA